MCATTHKDFTKANYELDASRTALGAYRAMPYWAEQVDDGHE